VSLGDPGLSLLLDADRLADAVGRPVRATHLRPKLGVSAVASLVDEHGLPWGWVRTLTGDARAKAGKARERAAEVGLADALGEVEITGRGTLVQWGPLTTDPRLAAELARLGGVDGALPAGTTVLRHNPLRRLVLRQGELVVRVTADDHRQRLRRVARDLAAAGAPVVAPVPPPPGMPCGRRVSWWPWVHGEDASGATDRRSLVDLGRAVGRLHGVDAGSVRGLERRGWDDLRSAAERSVVLLEAVAPGAATGARRVLDRLPSEAPGGSGGGAGAGRTVVCHGDLSRDQCLVREDGTVVLTDLDRAAVAPAVVDLAGLLAADLVGSRAGGEQVADGYAQTAPRVPVLPGAWVAACLLARVAEPWRGQAAGWHGETVRRSLLAGTALSVDDAWGRPAEQLEHPA
jgi:Ser/Thr protein kinase RdoA (MazF antagonist)